VVGALGFCSLMCAARPPEVVLASAKMPPMRCTVLSTMARPRPAPVAAVRAASPRKNGLIRLGSASGDTPMPWSRTFSSTHSLRDLAAMSTLAMPVSGVLP
jgi:hypothetical protein